MAAIGATASIRAWSCGAHFLSYTGPCRCHYESAGVAPYPFIEGSAGRHVIETGYVFPGAKAGRPPSNVALLMLVRRLWAMALPWADAVLHVIQCSLSARLLGGVVLPQKHGNDHCDEAGKNDGERLS